MYVIKYINEEERKRYDDQRDLQNLLNYIYNSEKTCVDPIRVDTLQYMPCVGCEPFFFPKDCEQDPETVFNYMLFNNYAFGVMDGDLARHRVVSFDAGSDILPGDLDSLGRLIARFYAGEGYIAAYCVHTDKCNLHIHIVVDTIGYQSGSRFSISFEKNKLWALVSSWEADVYTLLASNEKRREQQEELLYGKPQYGHIALNAVGQIHEHRKTTKREK